MEKDVLRESAPAQAPPAHPNVSRLSNHSSTTESTWQPSWKASLAVRGMTCGSCVNTITHNLERNSGWKVNVNLMANQATVVYHGPKEDADRVVEAIEDLGYEAVLDQVVRVDADHEGPQDRERTVDIAVDGFRCGYCPARVIQALETEAKGNLEILTEPSTTRPIVKIRYTPDAPHFTIRHILAAIEQSDRDFTARIYHPPTLEERARQIAKRHQRDLLFRVIVTAIITVPTFVVGIIYMTSVPDDDPGKMWLMEPWKVGIGRAQFILLALATPVFFWPASIFHRRAIREIVVMWRPSSTIPLEQRFYRFGSMDLLVSLGTGIAYLSSCAQMIAAAVDRPRVVDESNFYFDAVVFLALFLLLGRLLEAYSKSRAGDAVASLAKLRPTTATLVQTDKRGQTRDIIVPVDQLEFNDRVRIPHGASPACDGIVAQGQTQFDESSLTGESRPITKTQGDPVYAGTVNNGAPVVITITGAAGRSMLDNIVRIVREGQATRAPVERVADVLTSYFVPAITLIAIITWLVWLAIGTTGTAPGHFLADETSGSWVAFSLRFAIAVFVVACPCGLALAAPTAIVVGSGLAAKHGILVKGGGEAFEKASRVDCVVFDKTGTLTVGGQPKVIDSLVGLDGPAIGQHGVLAAIQGAEETSTHPVAKAIVAFCHSELEASSGQQQVSVSDAQEIPGRGVKAVATYDASDDSNHAQTFDVSVGNEALMADLGADIPPEVAAALQVWKTEAKSVALAAVKMQVMNTETDTNTEANLTLGKWTLTAAFSISDPIRPETPAVIRTLREGGIDVWMLSGDNTTTARAVANQVGIPASNVVAEVLPTQKHERIAWLQATLKAGSETRRRHTRSGLFRRRGTGSPEQQLEEGRRGREDQAESEDGLDAPAQGDTERRATIAMVGDGINDAAALNTADVGVAVGSGSDVAIASAGFVLISGNLGTMVTLLHLSKAVLRRIKFNFAWALAYNVVAIPVAAGCFYPIVVNRGPAAHGGEPTETRIRLEPEWAGLAMAASSISVVLSSLALRSAWWGVGFRPQKVG